MRPAYCEYATIMRLASSSRSNNHSEKKTMSAEYLHKMFGLDGQTAVVIGGAGVLGGALCRGLNQAGRARSSWRT